jgi:hypothetical protein
MEPELSIVERDITENNMSLSTLFNIQGLTAVITGGSGQPVDGGFSAFSGV